MPDEALKAIELYFKIMDASIPHRIKEKMLDVLFGAEDGTMDEYVSTTTPSPIPSWPS